jgi:hypothetical protein
MVGWNLLESLKESRLGPVVVAALQHEAQILSRRSFTHSMLPDVLFGDAR